MVIFKAGLIGLILSFSNLVSAQVDWFHGLFEEDLSSMSHEYSGELTPPYFSLGQSDFEARGLVTGFGDLKKDGLIDFALIMSALKFSDFLDFDIAKIISIESDELRVLGQSVDIPSNLSIPRQRESYVLPFTVSKPLYRYIFREPGTYPLIATRGQFPVRPVVNGLRNNLSLFDMVNYFSFQGGAKGAVQIEKDGGAKDFNASQMIFDQELEVEAPRSQSPVEVLAVSFIEENDLFYPTDIKRFYSGDQKKVLRFPREKQIRLAYISTGATQMIPLLDSDIQKMTQNYHIDFDLLQKQMRPYKSFSQMSLILSSPGAEKRAEFLAPVAPPQIEAKQIRLLPPASVQGVQPLRTYLRLYEVEIFPSQQGIAVERRTSVWEAQKPGWVSQISVPMFQLNPQKKYRWEVLYSGKDGQSGGQMTHATRNSVDLVL